MGTIWENLVTASIGALVAIGAASASADVSSGAVTKTFSLIAKPNSGTTTLVNIDSLLINARCDATGRPLVFAFTSAGSADVFGRTFDGYGRVHILKNTSFTNKTKGIQLSPLSGDFDATGSVLFETSSPIRRRAVRTARSAYARGASPPAHG